MRWLTTVSCSELNELQVVPCGLILAATEVTVMNLAFHVQNLTSETPTVKFNLPATACMISVNHPVEQTWVECISFCLTYVLILSSARGGSRLYYA